MNNLVVKTKKTVHWLDTIRPESGWGNGMLDAQESLETYRWLTLKAKPDTGIIEALSASSARGMSRVTGFHGAEWGKELLKRFQHLFLSRYCRRAADPWLAANRIALMEQSIVPMRYYAPAPSCGKNWHDPGGHAYFWYRLNALLGLRGQKITTQLNLCHIKADTIHVVSLYVGERWRIQMHYGYAKNLPELSYQPDSDCGWYEPYIQRDGEMLYDFVRRADCAIRSLLEEPKGEQVEKTIENRAA